MKILILFLTILFTVAGCGSHKGAVKPNAGLADFNKYGKAYYLSLEQIQLGYTQDQVTNEYGSDYEVIESKTTEDHSFETWRFVSYRATFSRDPIDKYVFVSFRDQLVINKREEWLGRREGPSSQSTNTGDKLEKLERLKRLLDQGAITQEEYETMKRDVMEQM